MFIGKLEAFTAAVDGRYPWLAVVAVVNTVASLFYLRWLVPVFQTAPADVESPRAGLWPRIVALSAATASLVLGLAAAAA